MAAIVTHKFRIKEDQTCYLVNLVDYSGRPLESHVAMNNKEKSDRNIYTGSFGIIHANGDMRFNIMIRTLLNFKNKIDLSVASGVILGSTAKKEYNENYIKANSLLELFD